MLKPVQEVKLAILDFGSYVHIAQALGEQCAKVWYWSPWESAFPKVEDDLVGFGFESFERVRDFWSIRNQVDAWVFPDCGMTGLQQELIRQGFPVWGHRGSDELECNRGLFLQTLKELELDVTGYERVQGVDNLREYLRDKEDKYVKLSRWRGCRETCHWRSWDQDRGILDDLASRQKRTGKFITFYVMDPIETDFEGGTDLYCIDGIYPSLCVEGYENKDKSYLCTVKSTKDVDERIWQINEAFAPVLGRFEHRGAFSTEVRVKGKKAFFIDPTPRFPIPPSQIMTRIFANLADIVWHGANGVVIDPEPVAKFGIQLAMNTKGERTESAIEVDEDLRPWVMPYRAFKDEGLLCLLPDQDPKFAGWLVALGDSIQEAIDLARERVDLLPEDLECDTAALAPLLEEARQGQEEGLELTPEKIPAPSAVVEDNSH